jgi:hypothetical protein
MFFNFIIYHLLFDLNGYWTLYFFYMKIFTDFKYNLGYLKSFYTLFFIGCSFFVKEFFLIKLN